MPTFSLDGALSFSGSLTITAKTIDPLLQPFRVTGVFLIKYTTDLAGGDESVILGKSRYYLQPTLTTGLGIPTPSIRTGNAYRMDGSYFAGLNITSRTVTITIPVIGDIQAERAELYNMFSQDPALSLDTYYNLYLELDTGFMLVLHKVVLDAMTDNIANPRWQLLNISFFSADPWWYSTRLKNSTVSTVYSGPPDTDLYAALPVECLGTGIAYPKITITGQSYQFLIVNLDTQQVIGPISRSCGPGEVLTIVTSPTAKRGVFSSVPPNNVINEIDVGNLDFWLDPGFPLNHLEVYGFATGGTVTTKVEWYESYIGV